MVSCLPYVGSIDYRVGSVYCSDRKLVPADNLTCCYQQPNVIALLALKRWEWGATEEGERSLRVEMRLGAAVYDPVELT